MGGGSSSIAALLPGAGCRSDRTNSPEWLTWADLDRKVTRDECLHFVLGDLDRQIQALEAKVHNGTEANVELSVTRHERERQERRLEAFLSRAGNSDQLWTYRTYATKDGRGGSMGLARTRDSRIEDFFQIMIID